jgi:hypothetical protein
MSMTSYSDPIFIMDTYREKVLAGDAAGAVQYIKSNFDQIPEDMQGMFLIDMLTDAGSGDELTKTAADVQEACVDALEVIDETEKQLLAVPA